jgi:hypothetical protein
MFKNILFIGPFSCPITFQQEYHHSFLPFISKNFNTKIIDTFDVEDKVYDLEKLVDDNFKNDFKTIIFFTAGQWCG